MGRRCAAPCPSSSPPPFRSCQPGEASPPPRQTSPTSPSSRPSPARSASPKVPPGSGSATAPPAPRRRLEERGRRAGLLPRRQGGQAPIRPPSSRPPSPALFVPGAGRRRARRRPVPLPRPLRLPRGRPRRRPRPPAAPPLPEAGGVPRPHHGPGRHAGLLLLVPQQPGLGLRPHLPPPRQGRGGPRRQALRAARLPGSTTSPQVDTGNPLRLRGEGALRGLQGALQQLRLLLQGPRVRRLRVARPLGARPRPRAGRGGHAGGPPLGARRDLVRLLVPRRELQLPRPRGAGGGRPAPRPPLEGGPDRGAPLRHHQGGLRPARPGARGPLPALHPPPVRGPGGPPSPAALDAVDALQADPEAPLPGALAPAARRPSSTPPRSHRPPARQGAGARHDLAARGGDRRSWSGAANPGGEPAPRPPGAGGDAPRPRPRLLAGRARRRGLAARRPAPRPRLRLTLHDLLNPPAGYPRTAQEYEFVEGRLRWATAPPPASSSTTPRSSASPPSTPSPASTCAPPGGSGSAPPRSATPAAPGCLVAAADGGAGFSASALGGRGRASSSPATWSSSAPRGWTACGAAACGRGSAPPASSVSSAASGWPSGSRGAGAGTPWRHGLELAAPRQARAHLLPWLSLALEARRTPRDDEALALVHLFY